MKDQNNNNVKENDAIHNINKNGVINNNNNNNIDDDDNMIIENAQFEINPNKKQQQSVNGNINNDINNKNNNNNDDINNINNNNNFKNNNSNKLPFLLTSALMVVLVAVLLAIFLLCYCIFVNYFNKKSSCKRNYKQKKFPKRYSHDKKYCSKLSKRAIDDDVVVATSTTSADVISKLELQKPFLSDSKKPDAEKNINSCYYNTNYNVNNKNNNHNYLSNNKNDNKYNDDNECVNNNKKVASQKASNNSSNNARNCVKGCNNNDKSVNNNISTNSTSTNNTSTNNLNHGPTNTHDINNNNNNNNKINTPSNQKIGLKVTNKNNTVSFSDPTHLKPANTSSTSTTTCQKLQNQAKNKDGVENRIGERINNSNDFKNNDYNVRYLKSGGDISLIPARDVNHEGPRRVYTWTDF
ncbi:hypothetical protein HELRODRAFT_192427 [Helobdella robusta]|uniref:Uncharacterized protein n=1 Tax=Helobdella robusta TaxID=6412 RepID=T1FTY3_HELRO|nr:hypothetical protein HELRODRAFT_192427 [Helobdella robusta]ESO00813.1 hypothetical protein HELRODRAFT_192427 [Helobdella robusta]